jgi:plastocyanin domain-containing protein
MFSRKMMIGSLAGLGFWLSLTAGVAVAQMPDKPSKQADQFRRIEQPLELRVAVTMGGLALINLELWWFLSKQKHNIRELKVEPKQPLVLPKDCKL